MIRSIQETTGASVEVEDDGTVTVASANGEGAKAALAQIDALTASVEIGRIYHGRVTSVKDFGAFVEILPGKDGLCHISELSNGYISDVGDVCQIGDEMQVMVIEVDGQDRVKLSRKRAIEELGLEDEFDVEDNDGDFEDDGDYDRDDRVSFTADRGWCRGRPAVRQLVWGIVTGSVLPLVD